MKQFLEDGLTGAAAVGAMVALFVGTHYGWDLSNEVDMVKYGVVGAGITAVIKAVWTKVSEYVGGKSV